MTDVFSSLIGQDAAVVAMRHYVQNPVHAYLFSGPVGSGLSDVATMFAAALQCENHGCGTCEECRLALEGKDPDIHVAQRAGVSWRIEELREAERISRRRPLGRGYQIVIIEDVELTTTGTAPSAAALLKSLEEPPTRTIFLLTAESLPEELVTIESRCVEVRLQGLNEETLTDMLVKEGASLDAARTAAAGANGNLRRARVLVKDAGLTERIETWRHVPDQLDGTPAACARVVKLITSALDEAIAPLVALQEDELERRIQTAKDMGQRSVSNRKDIEAQFKREQRRFRIDEVRFGLTALTAVYRDRLAKNLEGTDAQSQYRVGACLRAMEAVLLANRRLSSNLDETLLLSDLMLSLMEF